MDAPLHPTGAWWRSLRFAQSDGRGRHRARWAHHRRGFPRALRTGPRRGQCHQLGAPRGLRAAGREHHLCESGTLCALWPHTALRRTHRAHGHPSLCGGLPRPVCQGGGARHRHPARGWGGRDGGCARGGMLSAQQPFYDGTDAAASVHHAEMGRIGRWLYRPLER